jgi:hypothetical protein
MADWNALRNYIKAEYKVSADDLNSLKLLFALDGGRSQLVVVEKIGEVGNSEWALISTAVCEEGDIDPRDALVKNSEMIVGGLALIDGGPVIFRHSIRLADLDPGEFDEPLRVAASFGDSLERELSTADKF